MIKSADVDKGGGGKTLIHKMWIKNMFFFLTLPLECKNGWVGANFTDTRNSGARGGKKTVSEMAWYQDQNGSM